MAPTEERLDRAVVVALALSPAMLVTAPPAMAAMEGALNWAAAGWATWTVEGELSAEMEETVPIPMAARTMVTSRPSWRQAVEGPAVVSTTIWTSVAVAEVEAAEPSNSAQYRR